jgi:hypothetical protein
MGFIVKNIDKLIVLAFLPLTFIIGLMEGKGIKLSKLSS